MERLDKFETWRIHDRKGLIIASFINDETQKIENKSQRIETSGAI